MKIMKIIKYFFEFIFVYILFIIFKIIGYKNASSLGEKIGILFGPLFRSKKKIENKLKNSNIGNNVMVESGAVIENNVVIGSESWIGPNVYIGEGTTIGEYCRLYPNVTVYHDIEIKNQVIIHSGTVIGCDGFGFVPGEDTHEKIPQIGNVLICFLQIWFNLIFSIMPLRKILFKGL